MLLNEVDYAISIWRSYGEQIAATSLKINGSHILELGPGKNLGTSILFSCQQAHVTTADPYHHTWDSSYHPEFYKLLHEKAQSLNLDTLDPLEKIISSNSYFDSPVRILTETAENLSSLKDNEFDMVFSNAVFEHIGDPLQALHELNRVTKINGRGVHQIDLRDHRDFSRPLEYLTMDNYTFGELFKNCHGECGNRFRTSDFRDFFILSGFKLTSDQPNVFADPEYLRELSPRRKKWANHYTLNDMHVLSAMFCIEKIADLNTVKNHYNFAQKKDHQWLGAKKPTLDIVKNLIKKILPSPLRVFLRRIIS